MKLWSNLFQVSSIIPKLILNNVTFEASSTLLQYLFTTNFIYQINLANVKIFNFNISGNDRTSVFDLHTLTGGQVFIQGFNARNNNFGIRSLIENKNDNSGSLTIINSVFSNLTFGTAAKVVTTPTQQNLVIAN